MFLQRIWGRVSNQWFVGKTASLLFGAAAFIVLLATPFVFGVINIPDEPLTPWTSIAALIFGIATPVSYFFLWTGMWWHWRQLNTSRRAMKRLWFIILLFGLGWGAVLYYLFSYLPTRASADTALSSPLRTRIGTGRIMAGFGHLLLAGWIGLFATVALAFTFPKGMSTILRPMAGYFVLIPTSLLLGTATYGILRLYAAGMKR